MAKPQVVIDPNQKIVGEFPLAALAGDEPIAVWIDEEVIEACAIGPHADPLILNRAASRALVDASVNEVGMVIVKREHLFPPGFVQR